MSAELRRAWLRTALDLQDEETPFPWQERLLTAFLTGKLPPALDIPTGLGKTAVMAIWLVARACGAPVPRRLIYVVDRRAVVDQATSVAEHLRTWVGQNAAVKTALGLAGSLSISTLRGQHVDNKAWLEDPAAPAIVLGTVDMIGSRLLFSGYGVSRKMRPYHAGLLGVDALIVLDEAHLVPPFERLVEQIASGADADGKQLGAIEPSLKAVVPPLRFLSLSATGRTRDAGSVFGLTSADEEHPVVKRRLLATKRLALMAEVTPKELPDHLARYAWNLSGSGKKPSRIIVFCTSRDHAQQVQVELHKLAGKQTDIATELFVGGRRVYEREEAARRLEALGFVAGSGKILERAAFVIATAAGEVGVDLDADHAVCDLVAWERMVQRLGRVNRRGDGDATVIVVPAAISDEKQEAQRARQQAVLQSIEALHQTTDATFDASPAALTALKGKPELHSLIADASTPVPLYPKLSSALIEAWAMTSLDEHTGRPEVAPWIRGWVDELAQTTLVWRKYLPVRGQLPAGKQEIEDFFEAAPVHISETLETETFRVVAWLHARGKSIKPDEVIGVLLGAGGELIQSLHWHDVPSSKGAPDSEKKRFQSLLSGKILVVSAALGGLQDGLLVDAATDAPVTADGEEEWIPKPKDDDKPIVNFRISIRTAEDEGTDDDWRESQRFDLERNSDGEAVHWLSIQKWRDTSNTADDRAEGRPQALVEHQSWTRERACAIGKGLGMSKEEAEMLGCAARLHDEGKRASNWQRAFRAERDAKKFQIDGPLAKTRGPINQGVLRGYRHEFGSLPYAKADDGFKRLSPGLQDLALHLIAAHHGFARPVIEIRGCDDAPPFKLQDRALEVALRYARLQKRWGPWGLAWWETLLRAADALASRDNDRRERGI